MTETIFVSLARKNEAAARPIIDQLTAAGLNLWVYYRDLKAGRNWRTTARNALVNADRCLHFMSPEALPSVNIRTELYLTRAYRKPIIPVMLTDCRANLREYEESAWLEDLALIDAQTQDAFAEIMRAAQQTAEPFPLNTDRIFISYTEADKAYALRLADDLRGMGGNVWIDEWRVFGGVNRFEARIQGLMHADYFVCCLSLDAVADVQMHRDLQVAFSRDLPVVPIITENAGQLAIETLSKAVLADEATKDILDVNWIRYSADSAINLQQLREAFDLFSTPAQRKQGVFISYRRADTVDACGRLYDRLTKHFGGQTVFKDVMDIPPGVDFARHIDKTIKDCAIVLVLIGNQWVGITDVDGRQRLDNPNDLVRIEVEQALQRDDLLVIPVLVGGARMPKVSDLPDSLAELTRRNSIEIRHDPDFHRDVDRLISYMENSQLR